MIEQETMVTLLAIELGYTVTWSRQGNGQRGNSFYLDNREEKRLFFSGEEKFSLALAFLRQCYKAKR